MRISVKRRLWFGFTTNLLFLPLYLAVAAFSIKATDSRWQRGNALVDESRVVASVAEDLADLRTAGAARPADLAARLSSSGGRLETAGLSPDARALGERLRALSSTLAAAGPVEASAAEALALAHRVVARDWEEYDALQRELAPIKTNTMLAVSLALLFTVLCAVAAGVLISRSIARPLERLTHAVRQVSDGDLRQPVEVPADEELQVLATSFNAMRERLAALLTRLKAHAVGAATTATAVLAAADRMAEGVGQQGTATEETSSAMEEIAAQIQVVSRNAVELASDAGGAAATARTIGEASAEVSRAAQELHGAIDRGARSVESVAGLAQQSSGDLAAADQASRHVNSEAESGGAALDASIGQIQEIGQAARSAGQVFEALDRRSREISGIVETLAEIADQTNLLALNAAIEAARAGDSGRGFAVVADEIRKLAERSLGAAKEVSKLVGGIREEIEHAVGLARRNAEQTGQGAQLLAEAGGRMRRVIESIRKVSELVSRVSAAVGTQSRSAEELRAEMGRLRELSRALHQSAATQATGAAEVVQAVERISSRTRQVADATVQVRAGGDQVVKAAENISGIARENQDAVQRVSAEMQSLAGRVAELQQQTAFLRTEAQA